jgi:hypothetical protein
VSGTALFERAAVETVAAIERGRFSTPTGSLWRKSETIQRARADLAWIMQHRRRRLTEFIFVIVQQVPNDLECGIYSVHMDLLPGIDETDTRTPAHFARFFECGFAPEAQDKDAIDFADMCSHPGPPRQRL